MDLYLLAEPCHSEAFRGGGSPRIAKLCDVYLMERVLDDESEASVK